MGRPRKRGRKSLPGNLYIQMRSAGNYYSYRNPVSGKSVSLGYDMDSAIQVAERSNREIAGTILEGSTRIGALLSQEEIVDQSYPLDAYAGVYFLISAGQILYVGKSADVEFRLGQHRARRKIEFDSIFIIRCPTKELARLEARYIRALKPPLNSAIPLGISRSQSMGL